MFVIYNGRWVNNSSPTTPLTAMEQHAVARHIKTTMSSLFGTFEATPNKINAINQIVQSDETKSLLINRVLNSTPKKLKEIKLFLGVK